MVVVREEVAEREEPQTHLVKVMMAVMGQLQQLYSLVVEVVAQVLLEKVTMIKQI